MKCEVFLLMRSMGNLHERQTHHIYSCNETVQKKTIPARQCYKMAPPAAYIKKLHCDNFIRSKLKQEICHALSGSYIKR